MSRVVHTVDSSDDEILKSADMIAMYPSGYEIVRNFAGLGWRLSGTGILGVLLHPFTDSEVSELLSLSTRIAYKKSLVSGEIFLVLRDDSSPVLPPQAGE